MKEEWKYYGDGDFYRVSSMGKVQSRRLPTGLKRPDRYSEKWKDIKLTKGKTDKCGGYYWVFGVKFSGKFKIVRIHRVVAELFIGEIKKGFHVNHIDGNRDNNKVSNLEIATPKQNIKNATDRGAFKARDNSWAFSGKIDRKTFAEIKNLIKSGQKNSEIAKIYNVHPSNISLIRHDKWKSIYKKPTELSTSA
jgi:hypothetical protein